MKPLLVYADEKGRIREHSYLLAGADRAGYSFVPEESDLIPLPRESELFFLPGRKAVGINPETGERKILNKFAVSAFAAPGYTLSATPLFKEQDNAPRLPLFAYGAVGYAKGRFWICATRVDDDKRQQFSGISRNKILLNCIELLKKYPSNRLVRHIIENCVQKYDCPAARNFALGRYEAPLPTSISCNARCAGCISSVQKEGAAKITPQCRLDFIPTSDEIASVMRIHEQRERERPIYSFGQGCEGDPLMNWQLLEESIYKFRNPDNSSSQGYGTINCNTNASNPEAIAKLATSGLTSMRVSLNSAIPDLYHAYYRPVNYNFDAVRESIKIAAQTGIFVSLNLLFFPGVTDTPQELEHLIKLCMKSGVSMIQWRNLNIDPGWYRHLTDRIIAGAESIGLNKFMEELKKACPWLRYGYFNPWLGNVAKDTYHPV